MNYKDAMDMAVKYAEKADETSARDSYGSKLALANTSLAFTAIARESREHGQRPL